MLPPKSSRPPRQRRRGVILVLFVFLAPVLLGLIGLIIDGGILLAAHRQAQNAADAAALAAALDKMRGATDITARDTANTFLAKNGLPGITLTLNAGARDALNIPPQDPWNTGSPYRGQANYVEVLVTKPVRTYFIQVLGVNTDQEVTARAVAGFEPLAYGEGAIVLDPDSAPGISISGNNTRVIVNGTVVINSRGRGYDQYGTYFSLPNAPNQAALTTVGTTPTPAPLVVRDVQIVGGVDSLTTIDNVRTYDAAFSTGSYAGYYYDPTNIDRPLFARANVQPDPLQNVPTPSSSNGAVTGSSDASKPYLQWDKTTQSFVNATTPQDIVLGSADTATMKPGIYSSISITQGATVTFTPGIYIFGPTMQGGGDRISITGGTVSVGPATGGISGVLFYNTGRDYLITGSPDSADGSTLGHTPTQFGAMKITGGTGTLTPYTNTGNPNDPFNGILLYQRRWNTTGASISGGSTLQMTGTIYAKWANFSIAGQGTYNAQFVVGTLSISGGGLITINATGKNFGLANQVYLVE